MSDYPFTGRDPLYEGIHDGIPWCIYQARITSVLCGYARIPDGVTIRSDDFDVHGGINFGRSTDDDTWGDCTGWVGFDTAHTGDHWDLEYLRRRVGVHVTEEGARWQQQELELRTGMSCEQTWTVDKLRAECERLCSQIASKASVGSVGTGEEPK